MPATIDSPVFDADHHLYETVDAFTRHLPDRFRGAIEYIEVNGRTKIAIKGLISDYIPNPTFDVVARPGAQHEYYRRGNPDGLSFRELMGEPMRAISAFRNPSDRLALLDEWTFDFENRIFPTPVITLPDVDRAVAELEWVAEHGAKVVLVRPAPVPDRVGSRSPGLPEFDPFWERAVDLGILIAMHASDSGYSRHVNEWEPHDEYTPFAPSSFEWTSIGFAKRSVMDAVAAMICHGALTRHPDLKLLMIENGSSWVAPLLADLRDAYKKIPQGFLEDPETTFLRAIHVAPFWEENAGALCDLIGVDNVLFGSDYPHPEGLANPLDYADHVSSLPFETQRAVMGGNLDRLMGISVPA